MNPFRSHVPKYFPVIGSNFYTHYSFESQNPPSPHEFNAFFQWQEFTDWVIKGVTKNSLKILRTY